MAVENSSHLAKNSIYTCRPVIPSLRWSEKGELKVGLHLGLKIGLQV